MTLRLGLLNTARINERILGGARLSRDTVVVAAGDNTDGECVQFTNVDGSVLPARFNCGVGSVGIKFYSGLF